MGNAFLQFCNACQYVLFLLDCISCHQGPHLRVLRHVPMSPKGASGRAVASLLQVRDLSDVSNA